MAAQPRLAFAQPRDRPGHAAAALVSHTRRRLLALCSKVQYRLRGGGEWVGKRIAASEGNPLPHNSAFDHILQGLLSQLLQLLTQAVVCREYGFGHHITASPTAIQNATSGISHMSADTRRLSLGSRHATPWRARSWSLLCMCAPYSVGY
jgi:hypothetical protein